MEDNLNEITCLRPIIILNADYNMLARIEPSNAYRPLTSVGIKILSDQTGIVKLRKLRYNWQDIRLLDDLMTLQKSVK